MKVMISSFKTSFPKCHVNYLDDGIIIIIIIIINYIIIIMVVMGKVI